MENLEFRKVASFFLILSLGIVIGFVIRDRIASLIPLNDEHMYLDVSINSFEECAAAGNPIMESYPEQCMTGDGRTFTRVIDEDYPKVLPLSEMPGIENPEPTEPISGNGCFVGGCSGQICSSDPDAVSTCEYREEYACYSEATCEPQADGQCGWAQTASLTQCLLSTR